LKSTIQRLTHTQYSSFQAVLAVTITVANIHSHKYLYRNCVTGVASRSTGQTVSSSSVSN